MHRAKVTPLRSAARARPSYPVPALDKALDILELLSREAVPLTQAQLARALSRNPSQLFRMLNCLEARGYLRREEGSGAYALTLKLFELSRTHSPHEALLRIAQPRMRALSDAVRESCHLSVLHRERVLVVAQEESAKPFRLSIEVGSLHAPSRTTSGRLFLAHMDEEERETLLARESELAGATPRERAALLSRLASIRARGYERTESERFEGSLDLGCLVGSPRSHSRAALVIAVLRQKDEEQAPAEQMLTALRRCAREIGEAAGLDGGGA